MGGVQLLFYASMVVFAVGTVYKMIRLANMPLHLRWDLYPIPHEKGDKAEYGGSYYEEEEWWTKAAEVSIPGELKEMAKEIIFIQSMIKNNKPLWIFSFPFHFGLYLSIGYVLLAYLGAILGIYDLNVAAESPSLIGVIVYYLTIVLAVVGAVMGLFGSIGLFFSRIFKYDLRTTSVWTDYVNVLLLAVVFATTLYTWATVDPTLEGSRAFVSGLITFTPVGELTTVATVHFVVSALFLLWLPFTHMTHFVGKYFTYHKVRWEDHPNVKGSKLESAVVDALGYQIKWGAPHIKSGGTWAEAATDEGDKEDKQ